MFLGCSQLGYAHYIDVYTKDILSRGLPENRSYDKEMKFVPAKVEEWTEMYVRSFDTKD